MRAFIALLLVAAAYAAPVLRVQEPIPGSYIVKLRSNADLDEIISTVRLAGGKVGSLYRKVFKGFAVDLSSKALELVSKLPSVEYIEENGVVRAQAVASWGIDRIDARSGLDDSYTPSLTGAGVDVYVIDTGVNDQHVDFNGRASQAYCASNLYGVVGGGNVDCNGHGTHCSGTIGSTTYGVAKGVNIIGVKVLSCIGSGSTAGVVEGIEWVANKASELGAPRSIASMSLGSGYNQVTNDAVDAMVDAGVETAVAAGNDNADACNYSPASSTKAVSVGSTTSSDARSSFSNYGQCVDIFAPGSDITSTWIGDSNTATNTISGTSMACPHVAGALALYGSKEAMVLQGTTGVISDLGFRSPDLFLYVQ